jgi:hypothetical protein
VTIAVTARPWGVCKDLARAAWTRTRALAHRSLEHAAAAADLDRAHLSRWESDRCDHPAPLAVLWSRELLPDEAFEALVAQARADRTRVTSEAVAPEDALVALLRRVAVVNAEGATGLRDGHLDPTELRALRPPVQDAGRAAARLLRAIDRAPEAAPAPDNLRPLRSAR